MEEGGGYQSPGSEYPTAPAGMLAGVGGGHLPSWKQGLMPGEEGGWNSGLQTPGKGELALELSRPLLISPPSERCRLRAGGVKPLRALRSYIK